MNQPILQIPIESFWASKSSCQNVNPLLCAYSPAKAFSAYLCKAFMPEAMPKIMSIQQATAGGMPVLILKSGSQESKGKEAQRSNFAAAKLIAELVRSSLGPRGMDKMLVDSMGDV